jgi:hypothetical protein
MRGYRRTIPQTNRLLAWVKPHGDVTWLANFNERLVREAILSKFEEIDHQLGVGGQRMTFAHRIA